jgi:hypothetical protein
LEEKLEVALSEAKTYQRELKKLQPDKSKVTSGIEADENGTVLSKFLISDMDFSFFFLFW